MLVSQATAWIFGVLTVAVEGSTTALYVGKATIGLPIVHHVVVCASGSSLVAHGGEA